jgi:hypothetical protein
MKTVGELRNGFFAAVRELPQAIALPGGLIFPGSLSRFRRSPGAQIPGGQGS